MVFSVQGLNIWIKRLERVLNVMIYFPIVLHAAQLSVFCVPEDTFCTRGFMITPRVKAEIPVSMDYALKGHAEMKILINVTR